MPMSCQVSAASAPDPLSLRPVCHLSSPRGPLTGHHVTLPYLTPPADVIQKTRQKPKLSIFSPKFAFVLIFTKRTILLSACILRPFRRQPAEFDLKTVGALYSPAFSTIARSSPGIYPSFPSVPGFFYSSPKQVKKRREKSL